MYVQGVESIFDLDYNGRFGCRPHHLRQVFRRAEREFSA